MDIYKSIFKGKAKKKSAKRSAKEATVVNELILEFSSSDDEELRQEMDYIAIPENGKFGMSKRAGLGFEEGKADGDENTV